MFDAVKTRYFHARDTKLVEVYLEIRKSKIFVGQLTRHIEKSSTTYEFCYDERYLRSARGLSLGPELPLRKQKYISDQLFIPFLDRLPSKENPAYPEYCERFGVLPTEEDLFVLLVTIGSRGPSSFVFEPVFEDSFSGGDAKSFRLELGLTVREFAIAFDVSLATVTKLENGSTTGRDILRRIEIYAKFPQVAIFEVEKQSPRLKAKIRDKLLRLFAEKSEVIGIQGSPGCRYMAEPPF